MEPRQPSLWFPPSARYSTAFGKPICFSNCCYIPPASLLAAKITFRDHSCCPLSPSLLRQSPQFPEIIKHVPSQGVTGLYRAPLAGYSSGSGSGLALGVGRGLLGAVGLPLSGALDLVSSISSGIANTAGIAHNPRLRRPGLTLGRSLVSQHGHSPFRILLIGPRRSLLYGRVTLDIPATSKTRQQPAHGVPVGVELTSKHISAVSTFAWEDGILVHLNCRALLCLFG